MPVPPEKVVGSPEREHVVVELLQAWNTAFFLPRGVELVLYKDDVRFSLKGDMTGEHQHHITASDRPSLDAPPPYEVSIGPPHFWGDASQFNIADSEMNNIDRDSVTTRGKLVSWPT
jgi:hypothetical protein